MTDDEWNRLNVQLAIARARVARAEAVRDCIRKAFRGVRNAWTWMFGIAK